MRDAQLRNEIFLYHPNDRNEKVPNSSPSQLNHHHQEHHLFLYITFGNCGVTKRVLRLDRTESKGEIFRSGDDAYRAAKLGNYFRFNLSLKLTLLRLVAGHNKHKQLVLGQLLCVS